ncbi:MAG: anti-sigma factor [Betaproteobacteria bacterium]|nr:anti-sigma factor [Betaproteobacteria bacterium]
MRLADPDLRHALAASYVLGTLRGPARRRFARAAQADPALARLVTRWEEYLTPLAADVAPVAPPARLWPSIEARLGPVRAKEPTGLWASVSFWRWLGMGFATAAVALLALTFGPRVPPPADSPALVAVLSTPEQSPRMVIEESRGVLKVRVTAPWPPSTTQDHELWVVPKEGAPRSLGVVPLAGEAQLRPAQLDRLLEGGIAFAVSLEPRGGSPTGAPTGAILCSGPIARSKRA